MKYVVTWRERPTGSVAEYEAAQKRVLEIFSGWDMPESLTFHQFVVRLGGFGGNAVSRPMRRPTRPYLRLSAPSTRTRSTVPPSRRADRPGQTHSATA